MDSKTKKISVIVLDVLLGVLLEAWSSGRYDDYNKHIVIAFVIVLILRLIFDWFIKTEDEVFYKMHMQEQYLKMSTNLSLQEAIADKMVEAMKDGNIEEFEKFKKVKKDL